MKAVVLQNSYRDQGEVTYKVTESTRKSTDHLRLLANKEVTAVLLMGKLESEGLVSFAMRLQEKEIFLQWVSSVLLGAVDQESIMHFANSVLFEALEKILPRESMWMAHLDHRDGDKSFVRLSTRLIDVYSKQTPADIVVPPSSKPGAFVALKENSVREGRCNRAYERGMCNINGCDLFHGRWNKHSWKLCDRAWERRACMRQWSEGGCRFSHDSSLFSARQKKDEDF